MDQSSTLVHLNLLVLIITLSAPNTEYDRSLLSSLQCIPDWKHVMGNPNGAILRALTNGTKLGRRSTITIENAIMICGTVVQSCAGTWLVVAQERIHTDKRAFGMSLVGLMLIEFENSVGTDSAP